MIAFSQNKRFQYKSLDISAGTFDARLLLLTLSLMSLGVIIVATASMDFAAETYGDPWFFSKRHGVYLLLGFFVGGLTFTVPMDTWNQFSPILLFIAVLLLVAVLIPGIGKSVNGSQRWLELGSISVQVSEIAKYGVILFLSSYLSRRHEEVEQYWSGIFKMIVIVCTVLLLLILEPDFGSSVVVCFTAGAMMFVAGVKLWRFALLAILAVGGLAIMAIVSPYRMQRLVTFLDPWSEQFSGGYQLVQSLIAIGRGEWLGVGLGNSVQKLFYLPEAHTDFVFAIAAEEFGLVGALILIAIFTLLVKTLLDIANKAIAQGSKFIAFSVFGMAVMLAVQTFINMGVAAGLLPTKGLTLPFISYGGSSLVMSCVIVAFILRAQWELSKRD